MSENGNWGKADRERVKGSRVHPINNAIQNPSLTISTLLPFLLYLYYFLNLPPPHC